MLTFEFEPASESGPCECCGGQTISLTRFVYKDGNAHAIYYAQFSNKHPERSVLATVGFGQWGEGSDPEQRIAFALELRASKSQYEVAVIDANRSPWREAKVIGRTLNRTEALKHPLLNEVFHITDHMVLEDTLLKTYLNAMPVS